MVTDLQQPMAFQWGAQTSFSNQIILISQTRLLCLHLNWKS